MDGTRFDDLTRAFASGATRRSFLRSLATTLAAGGSLFGRNAARAAACNPEGSLCRKAGECCTNTCGPKDVTGRSRCGCLSGSTLCRGVCKGPADFAGDFQNCGGCGQTCASGQCVDGQCLALGGNACTASSECVSGFCVDGVCCDGACTGQCEACNREGALGICIPVTGNPVGDRPSCSPGDGICGGGTCDGVTRDACGYADAGSVCGTKTISSIFMHDATAQSVCDAGRCCDGGISEVEWMRNYCDPSFSGICCTDGESCCPNASETGCCEHCFGHANPTAGWAWTEFECCPAERLCPPLSESNPRPPFCCEGQEVCVDNDSGTGCFHPDIVCDGDVVCPEKCCVAASGAKTCCASDEICSSEGCVVPPADCGSDADCPEGTTCVQPGVCCAGDRICGIPLSEGEMPIPNLPRAYCCEYGEGCSEGGPVCCGYPTYLCGGPCLCTSRGSFSRF